MDQFLALRITLYLVRFLSFDLFSKKQPTSSYDNVGTALRTIKTLKSPSQFSVRYDAEIILTLLQQHKTFP